MVTQTIKVDLLNKIPSENIIFRQGEVGREIVFEVYNDGVAVDLDEYDVTFAIYKPDGNFVIVSGTVDNDTVTVEETAQMTAVCGRGCFDLKLAKTGEAIYTYNGFVEIDAPIEAVTTINSVSTVFGLIFPDDFQEKLTAGENITIIDNVISASGGGGSSYTAGDYISILNDVIDVKASLISIINGKANESDLVALLNIVSGKQDVLTAGDYISILNNVIDVKSSLISAINGKADASALNGKQDVLTAGDYISILNNVIDIKSSLISTINGKADASALNGKQDVLTAGSGISIVNNVISATGGGIDLANPDYTYHRVNVPFTNGWSIMTGFNELPAGNYFMYMYLDATAGLLDKIEQFVLMNIGDSVDQSSPFARVYFNKAVNTSNNATKNSFQGYVRKLNVPNVDFLLYTQAIARSNIDNLYAYFWEV